MPSVTKKSFAKVNWHLAVGARRPDGYHPIASVFQKASLHDDVTVTIEGSSSFTLVSGLEGCVSAGSSTVDKAISLWREATMSKANVFVDVHKRIPVQSGLGGGSSNAATVLLALNSLADSRLSFGVLCEIGLNVGCDVPFFLQGCDAACVYGVGETVIPIEARHDLKGFLLVPNGEKVSTAKAYAAMDERSSFPALEPFNVLFGEYRKPFCSWNFRNDFELVNRRPNIPISDGERLSLTGSGSCWILLSNDKENGSPQMHPEFEAMPIQF